MYNYETISDSDEETDYREKSVRPENELRFLTDDADNRGSEKTNVQEEENSDDSGGASTLVDHDWTFPSDTITSSDDDELETSTQKSKKN